MITRTWTGRSDLTHPKPDGPMAIPIMDSAGLLDVTAFRRHEGVVAFQVPPECTRWHSTLAKAATQLL